MNTKLTLNLDKSIIESAKEYAKDNSISLSKLIENYLDSLTKRGNKSSEISPLVKSLTGIVPQQPNSVVSNDRYDYLRKKYS